MLALLRLACWLFRRSYKVYNVSLTFIEQQFNQIEKQLISCNAKLESEQKQHERLQKEHEESGKIKVYPDFVSNLQDCTGKLNPVSNFA